MKKMALLLVLTATLTATINATIRRVNNAPGVNSVFPTLTAAINSSVAGDTIHLEGSLTAYAFTNVNKRLVITGPGYFFNDTVANPHTQATKLTAEIGLLFGAGSKGTVVQGLTLGTIQLSDSFITIQRNNIVGNIILGHSGNTYGDTIRHNFFSSSSNLYNNTNNVAHGLLFYNNIITRSNGNFLSVDNLFTVNGYFVNNTFATPSSQTVNLICSNFTFQNNIFNNITFGTNQSLQSSNIFVNNIAQSGIPSGVNNNQTNINPIDLFIGWGTTGAYSSDNRYRLKVGAAAIGAGVLNATAVDCGAFGGPAPYILSGMPPVPSIYSLTVPAQVNSGTATINISLSAVSH